MFILKRNKKEFNHATPGKRKGKHQPPSSQQENLYGDNSQKIVDSLSGKADVKGVDRWHKFALLCLRSFVLSFPKRKDLLGVVWEASQVQNDVNKPTHQPNQPTQPNQPNPTQPTQPTQPTHPPLFHSKPHPPLQIAQTTLKKLKINFGWQILAVDNLEQAGNVPDRFLGGGGGGQSRDVFFFLGGGGSKREPLYILILFVFLFEKLWSGGGFWGLVSKVV